MRCTVTPVGNGMAIGGIDSMLANDAIKAMKGSFHVRVGKRRPRERYYESPSL